MDDMITKSKLNASSRQMAVPGAKEVYVRHMCEEVLVEDRSPWTGTCFLIHPDVTLEEFFKFKE